MNELLHGWKRNDAEVAKHLSQLQRPTFGDAAPNLRNYWQGQDVGLWAAAKKVNKGQHLPADKQTIGDCVSHGHARGIDYLYCAMQAAGQASGYSEGITSCMSEALYGEAREVGNDLGSQDGAVGVWAVQALQKFGYIGRGGKPYDGSLAKQYGRTGAPQTLKDAGRAHILESYAQVQTPDDCANSLMSGRPVTVCSNQGFTLTRDANGVCAAQGVWPHCMLIIGVYTVNSKRYFVILQSWGQNMPDGPCPAGNEAPDNSFGAAWDVVGRMLSQGDSYSLNGVKGWEPLPPLDWVM